jgi:RimJ/RimL family protein N-acetyltransferase
VRLVLDQPAAVAAWVAAHIPQMGGAADFGPSTAIGVVSADGRALGGVVFHNYQPRFRNIEVSFASESRRWLTRNLIRQILAYPFDQLGCQRLTAITPKNARAARAFLDHFGFKREGVVRRGFGTDDAIISGLMRREWMQSRWVARPPRA